MEKQEALPQEQPDIYIIMYVYIGSGTQSLSVPDCEIIPEK